MLKRYINLDVVRNPKCNTDGGGRECDVRRVLGAGVVVDGGVLVSSAVVLALLLQLLLDERALHDALRVRGQLARRRDAGRHT